MNLLLWFLWLLPPCQYSCICDILSTFEALCKLLVNQVERNSYIHLKWMQFFPLAFWFCTYKCALRKHNLGCGWWKTFLRVNFDYCSADTYSKQYMWIKCVFRVFVFIYCKGVFLLQKEAQRASEGCADNAGCVSEAKITLFFFWAGLSFGGGHISAR